MYLKRPANTSSGCCWYVLFLRSDKEIYNSFGTGPKPSQGALPLASRGRRIIYIFYSVTSKPWLVVDRATGLLGQEEDPKAMEEVPDNNKAQGITAF